LNTGPTIFCELEGTSQNPIIIETYTGPLGSLLSDCVSCVGSTPEERNSWCQIDLGVADNILVDMKLALAGSGQAGASAWDITTTEFGGGCDGPQRAFGSGYFANDDHLTTAIGIDDNAFVWVFHGSRIVPLDIKPATCPNDVSTRSRGYLPMAILGTADFDVNDVDTTTLLLERADGVGGSVAPNEGPPGPHSTIEDAGTPFDGELCNCHELEGDGTDDLKLFFRTATVVSMLELSSEDPGAAIELVVTGNLFDGTQIDASDCIVIE